MASEQPSALRHKPSVASLNQPKNVLNLEITNSQWAAKQEAHINQDIKADFTPENNDPHAQSYYVEIMP